MSIKKLEWEDKYSVGVKELDEQHKLMFITINNLLDLIHDNSSEEHLGEIINELVKYKTFHFATEEKYFKKFNFAGAESHIQKHQEFNNKLAELQVKYPNYTIEFAFELIDFLEDWLINHLLTVDHEYKDCFYDNGLK